MGLYLTISALRLRNKRNKHKKKSFRWMGLLAILMEELLVNTGYGGTRREAGEHLAGAGREAMQPSHVSLWVRPDMPSRSGGSGSKVRILSENWVG